MTIENDHHQQISTPALEGGVAALRSGIMRAWQEWNAQTPQSDIVVAGPAHQHPLVQTFAEAGVLEHIAYGRTIQS